MLVPLISTSALSLVMPALAMVLPGAKTPRHLQGARHNGSSAHQVS
jgi:hypothetical protein